LSNESWNFYHPEAFSFANSSSNYHDCGSQLYIGIYGEYAGNYHLLGEDITGRMIIPPGITSSWTRNQLEEVKIRRESPAHRRGIQAKNGIPPFINSSWTLIQNVKIKIRGKIFRTVTIRISNSKSYILRM
jgi:hypothetical protein